MLQSDWYFTVYILDNVIGNQLSNEKKNCQFHMAIKCRMKGSHNICFIAFRSFYGANRMPIQLLDWWWRSALPWEVLQPLDPWWSCCSSLNLQQWSLDVNHLMITIFTGWFFVFYCRCSSIVQLIMISYSSLKIAVMPWLWKKIGLILCCLFECSNTCFGFVKTCFRDLTKLFWYHLM